MHLRQPSWSVRTALLALIAFMPTPANGAIGSLNFSDTERRKLAISSRTWTCETCGLIKDLLVPPRSNLDDKSKPDDSDVSSSRLSALSPDCSNESQERPNNRCYSTDDKCDTISENDGSNNSSGASCSGSSSCSSSNSSISAGCGSDGEDRDKSLESGNSKSESDESKGVESQLNKYEATNDQENQLDTSSSSSINHMTTYQRRNEIRDLNEHRRAHPPLILRLIFVSTIILVSLILRRIFMVIQW